MSERKIKGIHFDLQRRNVQSSLTLTVNSKGPELLINGQPQDFRFYTKGVYHQVEIDPHGQGFIEADEVGIQYFDDVMRQSIDISLLHIIPLITGLLRLGNLGLISVLGDQNKFGGEYVLKLKKNNNLQTKVAAAYTKFAFSVAAIRS